jgi:hypothetical protein
MCGIEEKSRILNRHLFLSTRRIFFTAEYPFCFFEDAFVGLRMAFSQINYYYASYKKKINYESRLVHFKNQP